MPAGGAMTRPVVDPAAAPGGVRRGRRMALTAERVGRVHREVADPGARPRRLLPGSRLPAARRRSSRPDPASALSRGRLRGRSRPFLLEPAAGRRTVAVGADLPVGAAQRSGLSEALGCRAGGPACPSGGHLGSAAEYLHNTVRISRRWGSATAIWGGCSGGSRPGSSGPGSSRPVFAGDWHGRECRGDSARRALTLSLPRTEY